jgi:integrase
VYAGHDPLTKKRHTLVETIPPGPKTEKARRSRSRRRRRLTGCRAGRGQEGPWTDATLDHLLERYLDQFGGRENTLELYRGHARNHISPLLGHLKVGQLSAETHVLPVKQAAADKECERISSTGP